MDFTPVIAQLWGMLSWALPLLLLITLFKSPRAKGHIGELLVRLFAHWQLDQHTYRRLHNVTLNTPDGTTQIDHVFLSVHGIFVLETKNMSGWQHLKRRSDPSAERCCPKCGNALVIRTRKTGANAGQQFWGCSAFPKCRIVQSL